MSIVYWMMITRSMGIALGAAVVCGIVLLAGCGPPAPASPRASGVEIFAEDTVTAHVSVRVTGDLQVSVRGENFRVAANRTFLVSTPASLTVNRGVGTATITSVDSVSRLAVVPVGTPPDSVDAATVAGTVVKFTRLGYDQRGNRLVAERP